MAPSKISVPHIQTCCCGCSLKTGSLIFAWINVIANILWFGHSIVEMIIGPHVYSQKVLGSIQIVLYVGHIIVSLVLLFGLFQRKLVYVKLWVIIACIFHTVRFFQFLEKYVILLAYEAVIINAFEGFLIATEIISFGYAAYSVVVIYNFYRQLVSEETENTEILMDERV